MDGGAQDDQEKKDNDVNEDDTMKKECTGEPGLPSQVLSLSLSLLLLTLSWLFRLAIIPTKETGKEFLPPA